MIKLTTVEAMVVLKALEKQVEDHEILLIDKGDNEFIRHRAHGRIKVFEELIKKIENVLQQQ